MTPGITRRQALGLGAGLLASAALSACGGAGSAAGSGGSNKVRVTMFVFFGGNLGVMPKAFAKDYMARHPNVTIEIYENSNTVGYPKMLAAKQTTPERPLVNLGFFNAQTTARGDVDDMWNQLDYAAMSNAKDVLPVLKRSNQKGIGIGTDQLGLLYNTKQVSPPLASWTDLWNPRYAGKVTFFDYYWEVVLETARLMGGGITDMDPGWNFWKAHAKQIRTIVTSNPQYLDVLSNGTAILTSYFNGTGLQWKGQGAPIDYVPPKEGAISVPVYLQTVKGNTPDQERVCQDIINEMLSPQWCLQWATTTIEVPANVRVKLPPSLADLPAFQRQTTDKLIAVDWAVAGKQDSAWRQRWDQDIKANI
jgi:putative spermidine/putrescine transport system substrate-binding protein